MALVIRSFQPADQDAVRQLILAGLGEHFGWIDQACNPDLDDIQTHYIKAGHVFVVAEANGEIIGTGALLAENKNTARLKRMSVRREYWRRGIGRILVAHLLNVAWQQGFTQVRVSTEPDWADAIGLYQSCGFSEERRDQVGVYFSLTL
ncbi:MAG: GNAT family N-acetyltransferase [Anaerolineae bacterium]|nr:GNAT family N-acetyltransferase [Anaerolineae bacterium]